MALPEESWAESYCCDYYPGLCRKDKHSVMAFPRSSRSSGTGRGSTGSTEESQSPSCPGQTRWKSPKQRRDFKVHKQRVVSLLFLETAGLFCWNISKKSHSVKGKSPHTVWKSDICVCPAWCAALGVGQGVKFSFLTPAWWLIPTFLLQKLWCSCQFNQIYPRTLFKVLAEV